MKLEEAIKHAKDVATKKYRQAMLHRANAEDEKLDRCIECMKEHEQLAEWLEELKELREYKKKMKAQFLDDIENPLEPSERLKNLKVRKKMKINAKQPSIKTYTLSHFKIGDVCMGVRDEHYYLVVKSEKEKKQIVDLTENEIIRDAGYMRFIPAKAELDIKDVG